MTGVSLGDGPGFEEGTDLLITRLVDEPSNNGIFDTDCRVITDR